MPLMQCTKCLDNIPGAITTAYWEMFLSHIVGYIACNGNLMQQLSQHFYQYKNMKQSFMFYFKQDFSTVFHFSRNDSVTNLFLPDDGEAKRRVISSSVPS